MHEGCAQTNCVTLFGAIQQERSYKITKHSYPEPNIDRPVLTSTKLSDMALIITLYPAFCCIHKFIVQSIQKEGASQHNSCEIGHAHDAVSLTVMQ